MSTFKYSLSRFATLALIALLTACGGGGDDSASVPDADAVAARVSVANAVAITEAPPESSADESAPVIALPTNEPVAVTESTGEIKLGVEIEAVDSVSAILFRVSEANSYLQVNNPALEISPGGSTTLKNQKIEDSTTFTGEFTVNLENVTAQQFCIEVAAVDSAGLVSNYTRACFQIPENAPAGSATPPVANAGGNRAALVGNSVQLKGSGFQNGGAISSFAWTQVSGTSVTLSGANTATASFTAPNVSSVSSLKFRLTVRNGDGLTDTDDVIITVSPVNTAPVTNNIILSVDEDTLLNGTLFASDQEGDALTYSVSSQPSNGSVTLNPSTGQFGYTPNANYFGSDSFQYTASDGRLTSDPGSRGITVNAVNDAPTISGTPATSVAAGSAYNFTPTAQDVDGDTLTFSVLNLPSWAAFNTASGQLNGTPSSANAGVFSNITIRVNDGTATVALPSFSITVSEAVTGETVYNTAFFDLELDHFLDPGSSTSGSINVFQDNGFYTLPNAPGNGGQVQVQFGPFAPLGDAELSGLSSPSSSQIFYNLFVDGPSQDPPDDLANLIKFSDGVYALVPEPIGGDFDDFITFNGGQSKAYDKLVRESVYIIPAGPDTVITPIIFFEDEREGIDTDSDGSGDYFLADRAEPVGQEFDAGIEIGFRQSDNFTVSNLAGDYGLVGMLVELQENGGNFISAFSFEQTINSSGSSTSGSLFESYIDYDPNASPTVSVSSETHTISSTYGADSTGLLTASYSDNDGIFASFSGLATPNGDMLVLQSFDERTDANGGSERAGESIFQIGVRRPAGAINPQGKTFLLQGVALERSPNGGGADLIAMHNFPIAFGSNGVCTEDPQPGHNLFVSDLAADNGAGGFAEVLINDDGEVQAAASCSYAIGDRGFIQITLAGAGNDPTPFVANGFIAETGDRMVFRAQRDETNDYHQRWLIIASEDTGFSNSLGNRQPDISVAPASANLANSASVNLTATVSDVAPGLTQLTVEWFGGIGSFSNTVGANTSWTAPASGSGTVLLSARVTDGNQSRVFDIPVTYGTP